MNPWLKLSNRELDLFAALIKVYYGNKHVPIEAVHKIINTDKVRKVVREFLGIKNTHYNLLVYNMKKKKILNNDGTLPNWIMKIYPVGKERTGELKFIIKVTE